MTALLKTSVLPTEVGSWLERLRAETARRGLAVRTRAHAGHGLICTRVNASEDALVGAIAALREQAISGRGSLVVPEAPPALARRVDVWGPTSVLELMRRVKARFDPNGTLNPERFVGGV
jgi:glycolate oxidase FAD binding subunit